MLLKALVVYTSLAGGTERAALALTDFLRKLDIKTDIREAQQVNAKDYQLYDICVAATYTFGAAGDLPDEIFGFYKELKEINLSGKVYGVIGSGDTYYGDLYCKSVDDFDVQFKMTGAKKGAESVKIELSPQLEDLKNLKEFARELKKAYLDNR